MPRVNWDSIDDNAYGLAPEGQYMCKVKSVQEKSTRNGDVMFSVLLEISKGDFQGRLVYDNLIFSRKALPRVKMACKALGIDTRGEADIRTEHLIGRSCLVDVVVDEYNGKKRNSVTFDGYHPADKPDGVPSASSVYGDSTDDIPF